MISWNIFSNRKYIIASGVFAGIITGISISAGYALAGLIDESESHLDFLGASAGLIISGALFFVILILFKTLRENRAVEKKEEDAVHASNFADLLVSGVSLYLTSMVIVFGAVDQFSIRTAISVFVVTLFYTSVVVKVSKALERARK